MRAEKKCQALPQFPSAGTHQWASDTAKLHPEFQSHTEGSGFRGRQGYGSCPGSSGPEGGGMAWHEDLQNPLKSQVRGCMHVISTLGRQRLEGPGTKKRTLADQTVQPNQ